MSESIPLLMNTRAGAMHAASGQEQLQRMAGEIGLTLNIIHTESVDQMKSELKQLIVSGAPKVAIAGGDGTVHSAIQELAHTETALGILSQGTFNNFASALRLHHNLPAALQTLQSGIVSEVDLGKIGDSYFTESAGIGLFADSLALYGSGSNKNFLRGLYAMTRLGLAFRAHEMRLVIDGTLHIERAVLCEVCNSYRIAQAVPIAPEADIADGLLDVVVIGDIKRRDLPAYLRALRAQMHLGLPKVHTYRARNIKIESRVRRNVHCDDKVVGHTPLEISAQPRALKVLVDQHL